MPYIHSLTPLRGIAAMMVAIFRKGTIIAARKIDHNGCSTAIDNHPLKPRITNPYPSQAKGRTLREQALIQYTLSRNE
jgi:hypothetical protein